MHTILGLKAQGTCSVIQDIEWPFCFAEEFVYISKVVMWQQSGRPSFFLEHISQRALQRRAYSRCWISSPICLPNRTTVRLQHSAGIMTQNLVEGASRRASGERRTPAFWLARWACHFGWIPGLFLFLGCALHGLPFECGFKFQPKSTILATAY